MFDFPNEPGVYLFKDESGKIIYVGKAKNLKKRVSSYFLNKNHSPKTSVLVSKIKSGEFIVVNNEVEALLLENKLIKQHSPTYNINLKDDKTYAYIKVSSEEIPKVYSTRKITKKGQFFGPYTDGYQRNLLVKAINRHHKLCTLKCQKTSSCLNYHIGLCSGANIGLESKEDYQLRVKKAIKSLKGNIEDLQNSVLKNMKNYSENLDFESAKIEKEIYESLEILKQKQQVDEIKNVNQDVIHKITTNSKDYYSILKIERGTIVKKENYVQESKYFPPSSFIANYYYERQIPHEIILNEAFWSNLKEKKILNDYLESLSKRKVNLTIPLKGEKKELLQLAYKNLDESNEAIMRLLKEKLELKEIPSLIDSFDVSNLKDQFIVSGMVQFKDLEPNKKGYRRFKIRSKATQDDFLGIYEAVKRRYSKITKEELPKLIMIDGGIGQLEMAKKALRELNLLNDVDLISIAKKEEEIYNVNKEKIVLNPLKQPLLSLRKIRDETHRFSINYNKKLRSMNLKKEFNK